MLAKAKSAYQTLKADALLMKLLMLDLRLSRQSCHPLQSLKLLLADNKVLQPSGATNQALV